MNMVVDTDIITNEASGLLSAFGATHYWKFNEPTGAFADSGSDGTAALSDGGGIVNWREAPGLIRGLPREYGFWTQTNNFFAQGGPVIFRGATTSLDAPGWLTFTVGVVGVIFSFLSEDWIPLTANYDSQQARQVAIRVLTDGTIEMDIQRAAASVESRAFTAPGVVVPGVPFIIAGSQRADGNGIQINHNGVNVPVTQVFAGTGVDIDSGPDQVFAAGVGAGACTSLNVATIDQQRNATREGSYSIVQLPFIFVNDFLTDSDLTDLHAGLSFDALASDFFEAARDILSLPDTYVFVTAFEYNPADNIQPMAQAGVTPGVEGDAFVTTGNGYNGVQQDDTSLIVSDYVYKEQNLSATVSSSSHSYSMSNQGGTITAGAHMPIDGSDTVGTMVFLVQMAAGIVDGQQKPLVTIRAVEAASDFKIIMTAAGGVLGAQLFISDTGGVSYTETALNSGVLVGESFMLTVVQDGVRAKLYKNAGLLTSSAAGALGNGAWFNDMGAFNTNLAVYIICGDNDFQFSAQGIWGANDFFGHMATKKALSAAEVADLWDAVRGNF